MTRQYYTAPIKEVKATNAQLNGKVYEYQEEVKIVEPDALFYYNRMGVLIKKENKSPMILEEELYDFFQNDFMNNSKGTYSYYCVNPEDLKPMKKEEEKRKMKTLFHKK